MDEFKMVEINRVKFIEYLQKSGENGDNISRDLDAGMFDCKKQRDVLTLNSFYRYAHVSE
jgi:hypothetical protein